MTKYNSDFLNKLKEQEIEELKPNQNMKTLNEITYQLQLVIDELYKYDEYKTKEGKENCDASERTNPHEDIVQALHKCKSSLYERTGNDERSLSNLEIEINELKQIICHNNTERSGK